MFSSGKILDVGKIACVKNMTNIMSNRNLGNAQIYMVFFGRGFPMVHLHSALNGYIS